MEMRLAGTRALVTGAGSDGIGRAAAIALARAPTQSEYFGAWSSSIIAGSTRMIAAGCCC